MQDFTRHDIRKVIGDRAMDSFINNLRREFLGKEVTVRIQKDGKILMKNTISFDVDACIEKYVQKIKNYKENPFKIQTKHGTIEANKRMIEKLLKIKAI